MDTIEIIIPNFNGSNLIKKNLPSVLISLTQYKNSKVTIVDDGSKQEDREELRKYILQVQKDSKIPVEFLENEKNIGFASNVNRAALISTAEIIILLNSDVSPEKEFLKPLISHFRDNDIFGVACEDKSIEGESIVLRGRGIGKWSRGFVQHERGEVDKSDTFWISGGSCAIKTSLFKRLGGFDYLYNPFYWEDIDLSYRAQKSGYKIIFENRSVVEHRHQEGSIKKHYKSNSIQKIAYRNQFIFVWKNITDPSLIASHIFWLPYHVLSAFIRWDTSFLAGFLLALFRIPAIILQRQRQKKFYKKGDKEIIN